MDETARQVQDELEAALEAAAEAARVGARLDRAREAERVAHDAAVRARQQLAVEAADVEKLESYSPTRIWAALRGSRDTDLDRERAEQQAAEYAVARAEAWLLTEHQEVRRAEAELAALGDVGRRRERALAAKEEWLRSAPDAPAAAGAELTRITDELAQTRAALTEVREAAAAGAHAAGCLDQAGRMLGSADGWATYDTFFGGGMLTDMAKYDRMDRAQRMLQAADQALRHLSTELADVGMTAVVHGLSVDGLTRTFDVWFDNIFTDWSVKARISQAAQRTAAAAGTVHEIRTRLAAQEQQLGARAAELVSRRERLLTGS